MGKYTSSFKRAQEAKPITNFAQSPKLGSHRVALRFVRGATTQKTREDFIESEFTVLESETEEVGTTRSCAWFINAGGWPGKYAESRLQQFLEATAQSLGDDRPLAEVGDDLVENELAFGIVLDIDVTPVPDKDDPDKQRRGSKGKLISNIEWIAVAQSEEDILAMREKLTAMREKPSSAKKESPKPETTSTTATGAKLGIARRLLGGQK